MAKASVKALLALCIVLLFGSVVTITDAAVRTAVKGQPLAVLTAGLSVRSSGTASFTCDMKEIHYALYAPKGASDPSLDEVELLSAPQVGPNLIAVTYDPADGSGDMVNAYVVNKGGIITQVFDLSDVPDSPCGLFLDSNI